MQTTFRAFRPLAFAAHCLYSLALLALTAPLCAAATGPVVSATISPATLPVTGGVITFSATVTSASGQAISLVQANWSAGGGYYGTVTLANGGSGNVYTGTLNVRNSNTSSTPYTFNTTVTATNDLGLSNSATVAGQTVQADSEGTVPSVGSGLTHILWTNTNGQLSLWNYDPITGNFSQFAYGPYAGWSAKAVADGTDGKTRVLWDNVNGQMSLWSLDNTTGLFTQHTFGPYAGWSATSVSVSP